MTATTAFSEFNGASATETTGRTDTNWKRVDDATTTPYGSSPINSSNNENSMAKIFALKFGGTWNTLASGTVKIDNNAPATGLSFAGGIITSYVQPATTASGDGAMSTAGAAANFVSSSTAFGAGTSTASGGGAMYMQAFRTQLQTLSTYAAGPGDIATRTVTVSWVES